MAGLSIINPLATICAGGMMMDTLGELTAFALWDLQRSQAFPPTRPVSASMITPISVNPLQAG